MFYYSGTSGVKRGRGTGRGRDEGEEGEEDEGQEGEMGLDGVCKFMEHASRNIANMPL